MARRLGLGMFVTGRSEGRTDAGRAACSGSASCTGAVRRLGLGTWVTGGSDGRGGGRTAGRIVLFGEVGGSGTARPMARVTVIGGGSDVQGSARVGGRDGTGALRAAGLGMTNAGALLPGTSTARP